MDASRSRTDLLKWKLILVAALGTVGLGLNDSSKTPILSSDLVLCLIPLVCIYADAICQQLQIRILIISDFFRTYEEALTPKEKESQEVEIFRRYESFCYDIRDQHRSFSLEDLVIQISTIVLSALIMLAALIIPISRIDRSAIVVSGGIGICLSFWLNWRFKKDREEVCNQLKKQPTSVLN